MTNAYHYEGSTLYCEQVALADIAARAGTPVYVYSSRDILERFRAYDEALAPLPHRACYAVKANSTLAILSLLARAGAGFDIVSAGELFRVLKAGGDASRVVFSGVGKTREEIDYALDRGIHGFNAESAAELELIDALASRRGLKARVSLRVNPDVDAATHPYISTGMSEHKFGVDMSEAEGLYARASHHAHLLVEGVSCHIGSQILDTDPMLEAAARMLELVKRLRANNVPIREIDFGGGLGVSYKPEEEAPGIRATMAKVVELVRAAGLDDLTVMVEPGRSIVGEAGVLLAQVLYRKVTPRKEFVVVNAAMNDLIRPSLYKSHHEIIPLRKLPIEQSILADVVGPVCETGDFLARERQMPNVFPGDLLAVCTAGAYGFVAASNYNARPRPAEVLVEGERWRVVRERETWDDLVRGEVV
jgi:diaminopimelate decarboxylase